MRLRCGLLLAAMLSLLAPSPAQADTSGWYMGAAGGWSKLDHVDSSNGSFNFTSAETNGYAVLGFAGYNFGFFRLEGELGYRRHDVKSLTVVNDGGIGGKGVWEAATRGYGPGSDTPRNKQYLAGGYVKLIGKT